MRRHRISIAVLFLGLFLGATASAQDDSFIQFLQVRGSRRPVELETHAGQPLDRARIARDVRRLWATGWFRDIRVEAGPAPEGIQVLFSLVEKPRLYLRRVEFEPEQEQRPLALEPGAPVDEVFAHRVAVAVRRQLVEEGYAEAVVEADLVSVGFQEADLLLRVRPGQRYHVEEVRFAGTPGVEPEELAQVLRSTRSRRLLPGLPGLWKGWVRHPPFSERRLEADRGRLHSLYLSRGYFDARVEVDQVEVAEERATVTFAVHAGPSYRVRATDVRGTEPTEALEPHLGGEFPVQELCHCLREEKRRAEGEGRSEFAVDLEIVHTEEPPWAFLIAGLSPSSAREGGSPSRPLLDNMEWVGLTARVEAGLPYTVGRIEFHGHHSVSDLTLRRAFKLHEGELFDRDRLRRSLARLNRLQFLEPVTGEDVRLFREPDTRRVHLIVAVREKKRGQWSLSGPLGPLSVSGPLQFAVGARLPAWGRGPLELSTYYAAFSLISFSQPALLGLGLLPQTRLLPVMALHRPYLPGQRWQSGFLLSPQLGWRGTLTHYGLTQARHAARDALAGDGAGSPGLSIPVWWRAAEGDKPAKHRLAGVLHCEAEKPRLAWLRAAGATALDFLFSARLF